MAMLGNNLGAKFTPSCFDFDISLTNSCFSERWEGTGTTNIMERRLAMTTKIKSKCAKTVAFIVAAMGTVCCNLVFAFANNTQADKVKQAFQSAQNTGDTFNTTGVNNFTTNFLNWVQSWMDGLGNIVPILTVTMIIVGIILSLITSFSKRIRGFGLGMALFALGIFILWLFLPTIIGWFSTT